MARRAVMERKKWFCQDCRTEMKANYELCVYICPECEAEVWFPDGDKLARPLQEDFTVIPRSFVPGTRVDGSSDRSGKRAKKKQGRFTPFMDYS